MSNPRIIVALDYPEAGPALDLARQLDPDVCRLKVGKELFVAAGPVLVQELVHRGFQVFLDLKFHDIPNTVARACRAAARLGVWMLNVHASGGLAMMQAAREALEEAGERPHLIAVTVLTSLNQGELARIGLDCPPAQQVLRLAVLAREAGLDGVVCSGAEAASLRQALGPRFLLVTPGIRPPGSPSDDQERVLTPLQALAAGADYLVVGRPITRAPDPAAVLRHMHAEISAFLGENA